MNLRSQATGGNQKWQLGNCRGQFQEPPPHRCRRIARFTRQLSCAELDVQRQPLIETRDLATRRTVRCFERSGLSQIIDEERFNSIDIQQSAVDQRFQTEGLCDAPDGKSAIGELLQPQESSQIVGHLGLDCNVLLDPAANDIKYLPAVVLDHHEVAVAKNSVILQLKIFGIAACLF